MEGGWSCSARQHFVSHLQLEEEPVIEDDTTDIDGSDNDTDIDGINDTDIDNIDKRKPKTRKDIEMYEFVSPYTNW